MGKKRVKDRKGKSASSSASLESASASPSTSSSVPWTLTDELPIKLEGVSNLVQWKEQVTRVMITEGLLGFLLDVVPPSKYASEKDCELDIVSEKYQQWLVQDQKLRTWLLSSLSEFMASFVVGWEHAWEVWSAVHKLCRTEFSKRIENFVRKEIKNTKKNNRRVIDYVGKINSLLRVLVRVGEPVSNQEHIDVILGGLPEEYNSLREIIRSCVEPIPVSHIESLVLIQEALLHDLESELPFDARIPVETPPPTPDLESQDLGAQDGGSCHLLRRV